jgi:hypothetical protein
MSKDDLKKDSRFNQGVGSKKKPLKNLVDRKIPTVENQMKNPSNKGKDILEPNEIPVKRGVEVNPSMGTPTKQGKEGIEPLKGTPFKTSPELGNQNDTPIKPTSDVNSINPTPEKQTLEPNTKINKSPEKGGIEVNTSNPTPEKEGRDVELFDNSAKLEDKGLDISPFSTITNLKNEGIDVIYNKLDFSVMENNSPIYDNDKISPFSNSNLSNSKNLSPIYSNDILQQSFESNKKYPEGYNSDMGGMHGGVEDTAGGSLPPHPSNHSLKDDLPGEGITYTSTNDYESVINQNPFGVLVGKTISHNDTGYSSNPLVQKHWDNIGNPLSEDSQEVNFMSGINSYFGNIDPAIPGFNRKNPLLNSLITQGNTWGDGVSRSHMGNLLDVRVNDGSEGSNLSNGEGDVITDKIFDFRTPRPNTPSHTYSGFANINSYGGTKYDELSPFQLYNFSGDDSSLLQTTFINGIPDQVAPELNDGLSSDGYNEYNYDPRESNVENLYKGTKFDDPLNVDLVNGGGLFNDIDNPYNSSFRANSYSFKDIAEGGSATRPIGQGYLSSKNAIVNYTNTGGVFASGSYQYVPGDIPGYEDSNAEGGTNLLNGSWFYGGNQQFPNTNNYLDPTHTWYGAPNPGTEDSPTRTVHINGQFLTGDKLGYGDLTFESLFDTSNGYPVGIYDNRLDIRWDSPDLGGGKKHPIKVYNVPDNNDRVGNEDSFRVYLGEGFDRENGWFEQDKSRITDWLDTNMGRIFVANQQNLWFKNRIHWSSPEKTWAKSSITDSIGMYSYSLSAGLGSNNLLGKMAGMIFGTDRYSYQMQLWETTLGLVGLGVPSDSLGGNIMTTVMSVLNMAYAHGKSPIFLGGNAFQVRGFMNKEGFTDKTNVSPTRFEDLLTSNLSNLVLRFLPQDFLQTDAGGMSHWNNPRNLSYKGVTADASKPSSPSLEEWGNKYSKSGDVGNHSKIKHSSDFKVGRYSHIPGDDSMGAMLSAYLGTSDTADEHYELQASGSSITKNMSHKALLSNIPESMGGGDNHPTNFGVLGDIHTLLPIVPGNTVDEAYPDAFPDDKKFGYPLYFKDLRDDTYLFFRGFIEGLTENVAPSWGEEQYIGRNEPVYHYEKTTRDITFTLKLMAQTRAELEMIYHKMEKLTSLAYPRLLKDEVNFPNMGKIRFKPPLVLFRLGDLYGEKDNEMNGFIRSLNYSYPDTTTWEHTKGNRVPKHITAAISFQVIHTSAPHMLTKFYGKNQNNTGAVHNVTDSDRKGTDYNQDRYKVQNPPTQQ